jgi:CheY-like chemotaxis protein
MIELFIENAGSKVQAALAHYAAGNMLEVERAAHSVNSSSGNLGAIELRSLAVKIERLAAEKNLEAVGMLMGALNEAFARVTTRLEEERRGILGMKRIAVVEDNPDNRELVRVILEGTYDVSEYETGQQAIVGIKRERPDLVILDISLPLMDGPEVVRQIRLDADLRDLPVIALTAHAMAGDREKYLAAGFNDYVTKPIIDENALLATIERWIHSGSAQSDGAP